MFIANRLEALVSDCRVRGVAKAFAPIVVSCLTFLFYLLFRTRNYYWDGISFALAIESVYRGELPFPALFHPNHLCYEVLGYYFYVIAMKLGIRSDALFLLQLSNCFFSACCGYVLFRLLRRVTDSYAICSFGWLLFSSGALWWNFSTDADAYILTTLLLLTAFVFLLSGHRLGLVIGATSHVAAMLFHELGILFYGVALVVLLLNDNYGMSAARRVRSAALYIVLTGALVASAYWLAFSTTIQPNGRTFPQWLTSHSEEAHFVLAPAKTITDNVLSYVKLFAGGKPAFVLTYWSFLVAVSLALIVGSLVCGVLLFSQYKAHQREAYGPPTISQRQRTRFLMFLASWILPYSIFLTFWLPWNGFYKLLIWPALVLFLAVALSKYRNNGKLVGAWTLMAVALCFWNFVAYIFPHSHSSSAPVVSLAEKINDEMPKKAVIFYSTFSVDDWYLKYFLKNRRWRQARPDAVIAHMLAGPPSGTAVCFETSAIGLAGDEIGRLVDRRQAVPLGQWTLASPKYNVSVDCLGRK